MALQLTDENIKEFINSGKPVVIDFGLNGADPVEWLAQSWKN